MTTVPDSYDFFKRFAKLPTLNQGQAPTCWNHQWANHLRAFGVMYDHATRTVNPDTLTYTVVGSPEDPVGTGMAFAGRLSSGQTFTFPPVYNASGYKPGYFSDPPTEAQIKASLWRNGVIQAAVPSRAKNYEYARSLLRMPLIKASPGDAAGIDHSNLAVGYTPDGVIVLNSWGWWWGRGGRAILTWGFIHQYGVSFEADTYGAHPLDGLAA